MEMANWHQPPGPKDRCLPCPGVGRHLYLYSTLFSMYIHMYIRIIWYMDIEISLSIYICT
jgi:hypothetical protein